MARRSLSPRLRGRMTAPAARDGEAACLRGARARPRARDTARPRLVPCGRARRGASGAGEAPSRRGGAAFESARRSGADQGSPQGRKSCDLPSGAGRRRGAAGSSSRTARGRSAVGARGARLAVGHRRQRLARRLDPLRGRARRRPVAVLDDPQRRVGHPRGGGRTDHAEAPRAGARLSARAPEAPLGGQ